MSAAIRNLSSLALALLLIVPIASLVAAAAPVPIQANLIIKLSATSINPGDVLWVNVTCSYKNNTTVKVLISEIDTGKVVFTSVGNVSMIGTYRTVYTPRRPVGFGDYTVWVSARNSSYFVNFAIEPSLQDLYADLKKIAASDAKSHMEMAFVWRVMLPYSFFLAALVMLSCYWIWRVPGGTKEELGQWLLSNTKAHKLRRLMGDIRGLDRRGYASRHAKTPAKTDLRIVALRQHFNQLEKFKISLLKRRGLIQTRILDLNDFIQDITNLQDGISKRIRGQEADLEKVLRIIEKKAFDINKENRASNDVSKISPDRFKRLGIMNKMIRSGGPPTGGIPPGGGA